MYLTTILQYMSYMTDKDKADRAQAALDDEIRKQKKK